MIIQTDFLHVLKVTALSILFLYAFWGLFVLSMGLYKAYLNKQLSPITKAMAIPYVALMAAIDFIANYTIFVVLFMEFPAFKDYMVTYRLRTILIKNEPDYRLKIAKFLCEKLLNPFDPRGNHCLPPK
jgi:hypothetical protein